MNSAAVPAATPPASVEFWMWTWETGAEKCVSWVNNHLKGALVEKFVCRIVKLFIDYLFWFVFISYCHNHVHVHNRLYLISVCNLLPCLVSHASGRGSRWPQWWEQLRPNKGKCWWRLCAAHPRDHRWLSWSWARTSTGTGCLCHSDISHEEQGVLWD